MFPSDPTPATSATKASSDTHAVLNSHLLLPHYIAPFNPLRSLEDIGKVSFKLTVLDDPSLSCIKLRLQPYPDDASTLHLLTEFPRQWKSLTVMSNCFSMHEFIDMYKACLPYLEELWVTAISVKPSAVVPFESDALKSVTLLFITFPEFFDSGILNSISSLLLYGLNSDVHKKTLDDLLHMLSQLPCLYDPRVWLMQRRHHDFRSLSKVESTSLRYLNIDGDSNSVLLFFALFSDCQIE